MSAFAPSNCGLLVAHSTRCPTRHYGNKHDGRIINFNSSRCNTIRSCSRRTWVGGVAFWQDSAAWLRQELSKDSASTENEIACYYKDITESQWLKECNNKLKWKQNSKILIAFHSFVPSFSSIAVNLPFINIENIPPRPLIPWPSLSYWHNTLRSYLRFPNIGRPCPPQIPSTCYKYNKYLIIMAKNPSSFYFRAHPESQTAADLLA